MWGRRGIKLVVSTKDVLLRTIIIPTIIKGCAYEKFCSWPGYTFADYCPALHKGFYHTRGVCLYELWSSDPPPLPPPRRAIRGLLISITAKQEGT